MPNRCKQILGLTLLIVLLTSCISTRVDQSHLKGDTNMTGEELYRLICEGSKSERIMAINNLAEAFIARNRTENDLELVKIPDLISNAALSHPFKDNSLANLWFKTSEVLIDELKTDNADEQRMVWVVLTQVARAPYNANYDEWHKRWPLIRKRFIQIMNQNYDKQP